VDAVGRGDLQLVGRIDLGGELPGLLGGAFEAEGFVAVAAAGAAASGVAAVTGGLGGDAALQGVRVELEDDDALGGAGVGATTTMPERMGLGMSA
jgi:hypothetical protein